MLGDQWLAGWRGCDESIPAYNFRASLQKKGVLVNKIPEKCEHLSISQFQGCCAFKYFLAVGEKEQGLKPRPLHSGP